MAVRSRNQPTTPPPPPPHPYLAGNALVCGDCLDVLKELPDECIDLAYLDPPFNSNHFYVAAFGDKGSVDAQLRDIWRWTVESEARFQHLRGSLLRNAVNAIRLVSGETSSMAAYGLYMGLRLVELRRVLKPTGSIYLHCDWHANSYLRLLMDAIYGKEQFRNEIVWAYTGPSNTTRWFPRKHDTILFYARGKEAKFFRDAVRIPYKALASGGMGGQIFPEGHDEERMEELRKIGKVPESWWTDINPLTRRNPERVGYPTQKPLALLERIIKASSEEGDLVLDPFCGCGTAADAAAKLGRGYIGIDISAIAVRVMEQRLASRGGAAAPVVRKMGWDNYEWESFKQRALMHAADAEDGQPGWSWAEDKVAGLLNALPNDKKAGDGGVDARYYTENNEVIPIQVKMHRGQVGRPDLDKLLGVQARWNNQGIKAPMSLLVTLYPPSESLRVFAAQQGRVRLREEEYPKIQVLSVQEMLTKNSRPKLPPVDPRYLVGDTQTRLTLS